MPPCHRPTHLGRGGTALLAGDQVPGRWRLCAFTSGLSLSLICIRHIAAPLLQRLSHGPAWPPVLSLPWRLNAWGWNETYMGEGLLR